MFCPRCGKEIKEESKFCPFCGNDIGSDESNSKIRFNKKQQQKIWIVALSSIIIVMVIIFIMIILSLMNKNDVREEKEQVVVSTTQMTSEEVTTEKITTEEVTTEEQNDIQGYQYVDHVSQAAYFRSEPEEESSTVKGEILLGTEVGVIKVVENGFTKIKYGTEIGYIKTKYLSDSKPDVTVKYSLYVDRVEQYLTLRRTPSTNGEVLDQIYWGQEVGFIETTNSLYSKIKYGNRIGYVMSEYLSSSMPDFTIAYQLYIDNVENSAYFRKRPTEDTSADNIITTIPLYTDVDIIRGYNSRFAQVYYEGNIGYIKWDALSDEAEYDWY